MAAPEIAERLQCFHTLIPFRSLLSPLIKRLTTGTALAYFFGDVLYPRALTASGRDAELSEKKHGKVPALPSNLADGQTNVA
jgi:hypothetical protein